MAKKFMIRCDMEGASGIVSYEQAEPGRSEYELGRKWFMSDLVALVKGLKEGGADEIRIFDEHCAGRNILLEELPAYDGVFVYAGKPVYEAECPGGIDSSFTGLILLGLHSKRGSAGCLLQHSYEPDIRDILIDGVSVGEIGSEARVAADFGVPLVMVTADSKGIEEARAFGAPECEYVSVKESLTEYGAICYPLAVTAKKIYEAAVRVASTEHGRAPMRGAVNVEVKFFDTAYAKKYRETFGDAKFSGKPYATAWSEYQAQKHAVAEELNKKN